MTDSTFDPRNAFETYRKAWAPVLKAQQDGLKAIERVGYYQYAVAGDYLDWSLSQAKAALAAQTSAEFISKQMELATSLADKLRARVQEFVAQATEAQREVMDEAFVKVAEATKKAA